MRRNLRKIRIILLVKNGQALKVAEFYVKVPKTEKLLVATGSAGAESYKIIMEETEPLEKLLQASLAERHRKPAVVITSQKELEIGSDGLADILDSIVDEESTRKKIERRIKSIVSK